MTGLIISGLPASGKGTQAALVAEEYGFAHIDVGESLREEVDQESDIGREAQTYMAKGELVPDRIIKKLMQQKVEANRDKGGIVFDGFPRTTEQATMLEKIGQAHDMEVRGVIYLETDDETILERIQTRAEETSRQDDQDQNIIEQRIDAQKKQLKPLLKYYMEQGMLFKVNGNPEIDTVFQEIKKVIEKHDLAGEPH